MDNEYTICGIDEAGRGCIAGSMFVCGVLAKKNEIDMLGNICDSKKLSRINRDKIYMRVLQLKIKHFVVKSDASKIDNFGLSYCIKNSLTKIILNIKADRFIFDGNSAFGVDNLEYLIKGDTLIPQISLASIIAKSMKDKESDMLDKIYPQYGLARHKGYATKTHIENIQKFSLSPIHRKSFKIKLFNL